jgi:hypothetical protein
MVERTAEKLNFYSFELAATSQANGIAVPANLETPEVNTA